MSNVNDRISPRGLIYQNLFYPWGLNREGVLFENGGLLNRVTFRSIFLIRKYQVIYHNNTSISHFVLVNQHFSGSRFRNITQDCYEWIFFGLEALDLIILILISSAVVNAQDLNDFLMVLHEISFDACSIHSTMTFRGGAFITTFCNLVGFFRFS